MSASPQAYSYRYRYGARRRDPRPRRLNVRLLVATLVVLIVAAPLIYFWHRRQLEVLSVALLRHAQRLETEQQWEEASNAFYRYWTIRQEPAAMGFLAGAYDKAAVGRDRGGVINTYERAVGVLPDRKDLRIRLAELLVAEGQYALALEQVEKVLAVDPNDPSAAKFKALALWGQYREGAGVAISDVLNLLREARQQQPRDPQLATASAEVLRREMKAEDDSELARQADQVMDDLVSTAPRDPTAYLTRHRYRRRYGLRGDSEDIQQALALAPGNANIVKDAAWDAHRRRDWKAARQLFERLVELRPSDANGYVGLGDAEFFTQRPQAALEVWNLGRDRKANSLPLLLRLAEAQIQTEGLDEAGETLDEIDRWLGGLAGRGEEQDRNWATASAALLRGRWRMTNGETEAALAEFQTAAALGADANPGNGLGAATLAAAARKRLLDAYASLHRWEEAAIAGEELLQLQVDDPAALLATAESWSRVGQLDRAVRRAAQAESSPDSPSRASLQLAQYEYWSQWRLPAEQRDWGEFDAAFQRTREQLPDAWELMMLEVDALRRGKTTGMVDQSQELSLLWSLERQRPDDVACWRGLVLAYESIGSREDADRALRKLHDLTNSNSAAKLLLAEVLLARDDEPAARRVLNGLESWQLEATERRQLDFARVRLAEARGEPAAIETELLQLAAKYPLETTPLERLLEYRLAGESTATVPSEADNDAELIERLRKLQGGDRAGWQYYAALLRLRTAEPAAAEAEEAASLLRELRNQRPYWSRTSDLAARLAWHRGELEAAEAAWRESLDRGAPGTWMCRRLMQQSLATGDVLGALEVIDRWTLRPPLSWLSQANDDGWLRDQLDLKHIWRERTDVALLAASDDAPVDASTLAMAWAWTLQQRLGDDSAAARVVDEFLQTQPENVIAHILRINQFLKAGDRSAVQREVAFMDALPLEPADWRVYLLGQAFQLGGVSPRARDAYARVPQDSAFATSAKEYLSRVLDSLGIDGRQTAENGGRTNVDVALGASGVLRSQRRLNALIGLKRAGRSDLLEAKRLLAQLVAEPPAQSMDRLLLATAHEQLGEAEDAGEQLRFLAENDPSARHLAAYVDFLLRQNKANRAGPWLERLRKQAADAGPTIWLRARWLAAVGRDDEIGPLVEDFARRQMETRGDNELADLLQEVAAVYRSVGMWPDAERWLRTLSERFPDRSEPLALHLLDVDAAEQAIRLCLEQLENTDSAHAANLLARVLLQADVSTDTQQRVLSRLDDSLTRFPENGSLLFTAGNLRLKLGQTEDAIRLLRRATEVQPGHYLAWNNLAALLAEQPADRDEAMQSIERAIEMAGYALPTLLDTKAVVLLNEGRYEEAAELLARVTQSRQVNDPRYYFHHATALDELGRHDAAKKALTEADDLGLASAFLTRAERDELDRLRQKYPLEENETQTY